MQNLIKYSFIVLFATVFSQGFEPGGGGFIPITPAILNTEMDTESSNFTINHGFSLIANSGTFGSTSMGVYSNQVQYNFSDRLKVIGSVIMYDGFF